MEDPIRAKTRLDAEASQYETGDGEGGVASGNGTPASAFDGDISSPDNSIATQGDLLSGIDSDEGTVAGEASDDTSRVISSQDEREDAADDPLSQTGTYEGKRVFRANELNQAGEDKEYFHPKDDHQFKVPADAQHHDLTPDVVLTPGAKPQVELKTDK